MTVIDDRPAPPGAVLLPAGPDTGRDDPGGGRPGPRRPGQGLARRLVRGRPEDPSWVRPALLAILAATAVLYLWDLGSSGWANSFYSAAVQAGSKSWKAFFFGSFDSSSFITVDKPPAALWVMDLSARMFGVNAWSILVPQALEGVATVALVYAAVRRVASAGAGLLAAGVMALTPVAVLMFRYNNPDALLVLLLTGAAYCTVRALERANGRWLVLAGVLVGTGFITKMMQAFLVLPAIGIVYLVAAPTGLGRRLRQLATTAGATLVAALWWPVVVSLVPSADRPYIGGSQNNSIWNLIFGYNGLGRISGQESGSVGGFGGTGHASIWGPTGWDRLFLTDMGGQISWLIPAALVLLAAGLWLTRRAGRTDRTRASLMLWGLWLLVTGAVFSFAQGIIHPYYTVALAPAIAALVGIGGWMLWQRRDRLASRIVLAAVVLTTAIWAAVLLGRSSGWLPWLLPLVLVGGIVTATLLVASHWMGRVAASAALAAAIVVGLAGPTAYALETANTRHSGGIVSAGPTLAGTSGGPGGVGGPGGAGFRPAGGLPGSGRGLGPSGQGQAGLGQAGTGQTGTGQSGTGRAGFGPPSGAAAGGFPGAGNRAGGPGGGGAGGGLLNASTPDAAVVHALEDGASHYRWVLATVGANSAAGYQLAAEEPTMAIGGFNGTDPAPTLAQFEAYVAKGEIHYFVAGGGGAGPGANSSSGDASQITSWVEAHFNTKTVGGTTLYDLTSPKSS